MGINNFLHALVEPESISEDSRRSEYVLNVLLLGSIMLSLVTVVAAMPIFCKDGWRFDLLAGPLAVCGSFCSLYYLSRRGYFIAASYMLIGIYFTALSYTLYNWGFDAPEGLLGFAILIVIAGVLLGSYFSFLITGCISLAIFIFGYMQENNLAKASVPWKNLSSDVVDILVYIFTLSVVAIVAWLSNRETEKSLRRARSSEAMLKKERDLLEIRVAERTKQLKEEQLERIGQMSHFVDFGKLSAGIFHDQ